MKGAQRISQAPGVDPADDAELETASTASRILAAIVIGRNEGDRLIRCLDALIGQVGRIVYVDSGSSDGSLAAAAARGVETTSLDLTEGFTAARARNAGIAALTRAGPRPDFVQFVDGDCELIEGWLARATTFLAAHPNAAVVCGRRRERFPDASIYNRLCEMEWNTPIGEAAACGGDSMMRLAAFEAVGGFDASLIAGEEPELCLRLRRAGWTVWRIEAEMTLHDAAITRFGQWWRRTRRGGWAWAEGAAMHGDGPERYNRKSLRSVVLWGGLAPLCAAGLALAAMVGDAPAAPLAGAAGLVGVYPLMSLRIARYRRRRLNDPWRHAIAYGIFTMLGKFAELSGVIAFYRRSREGGRATLIEYKNI